MGLTNVTLLPPHVLIQSVPMNAIAYLVSNEKTSKSAKVFSNSSEPFIAVVITFGECGQT